MDRSGGKRRVFRTMQSKAMNWIAGLVDLFANIILVIPCVPRV